MKATQHQVSPARRLTGLAAAALLGLATAVVPWAAPGALAATCADPGNAQAVAPWATQALGPEQVWPFTRGAGIVVAVLDSGVDGGRTELAGHVSAGYDAVGGQAANEDCLGTGTQVAGVIAAQPTDILQLGLAPDVQLLPIRVLSSSSTTHDVSADTLAEGIRAATERNADVIAVPVPAYSDTPGLRSAVEEAVRQGITVVAAVGDLGSQGSPTPYPAAYPDVIGVGAVDLNGARWDQSQYPVNPADEPYVDVMAPGVDVLTLQRGSGLVYASSTGIACGFVAATAALVRARWGEQVSGEQVAAILLGTAANGPGSGRAQGHGIVNPYAAVTSQLVDAAAVPPPGPHAAAMADRPVDTVTRLALAAAGIVLLAALIVILLAVAGPRGRRRRWRGTLAPQPAAPDEREELGPPIQLFKQ